MRDIGQVLTVERSGSSEPLAAAALADDEPNGALVVLRNI